jgi:hypothetical protein
VRAPPQSPYTQTEGLCTFASSIPPRAWCVICCATEAETLVCHGSAKRSARRPAFVSLYELMTSGLVDVPDLAHHLHRSAIAIVYAPPGDSWNIKIWYIRGKTSIGSGVCPGDKWTGVPWMGAVQNLVSSQSSTGRLCRGAHETTY